MKKKLPITIGISAYNEEKNIANLLTTIFQQNSTNFTIDKIIICSDGSTDQTNTIVKNFKKKNITLIEGKKRKGQAARINEIIRNFHTDILIFIDADILLASKNTLANLVKPFIENENIGLAGGSTYPYEQSSFTAQSIAATSQVYEQLRDILHNGNNVFGCSGHLLAISKKLAKKISIPEHVYANDAYLYFSCLHHKLVFKHVKNAKVWFHTPTTIHDQIAQNSRFVSSPYQLATIFGDIVYKEYYIPKILFIKLTFKQFLKKPFHSMFIFIINVYCKLLARKKGKELTGVWNIATSTKEGFGNKQS